MNIVLCSNRKFIKIFYIADISCPTVKLLINRLAFSELFKRGRKISYNLSFFFISNTNLYLAYSAERVNLTAYLAITASNQPVLLGRPVTVPNS